MIKINTLLSDRIRLLHQLGAFLLEDDQNPEFCAAIRRASLENPWFSEENIRQATQAIGIQMLQAEKLEAWMSAYSSTETTSTPKTVGIITAGNIPLVGFHDWLCVFISGNHARVKLSDKDKILLPFLVKKMAEWEFESAAATHFLSEHERLGEVDAVIATGSNNSARYFEQYFSKYPHIIRRNRTSVAILTGTETAEDLRLLSHDLLDYFGLGCRNVTKIFVPENYDFQPLLQAIHAEKQGIILNDKYKNNFDYTFTLYILNQIIHHSAGIFLLREDESLFARIASGHYAFYKDLEQLHGELLEQKEQLQCVVCSEKLTDLPHVAFGKTQEPSLTEYADGVDVMKFLNTLQHKTTNL